jgi:PAS domain S-box-containing protein
VHLPSARAAPGALSVSRLALLGLGTLAAVFRRGSGSTAPASDARYRSVVETMSDGVVVQNVDGELELCNARALELFGLTEPQLAASFTGRERWQAVRVDGSAFPPDEFPVNVTLRTGEPCRGVMMGVRRRDGGPLWLSVNTSAMRERGRITAVVSIFSDVTLGHEMEQARRASEERARADAKELAELAQQLRQAQKMESVGQLAGGIAHDFNNLLTAISCNVELLLDEISPSDTRRDDVVQIREATDRAASLTRQLLAFSRRQVLQPLPLDLNVTVGGMERMLRRVLSSDVRLRTQLDPALPAVFADAGQMEQVMMNLVLNARDSMPAGGTIVVRTSSVSLSEPLAHRGGSLAAGEYATLSVRDAGTGIAPDVLGHLFEPFFTTKPHGRGTGLGLATVQGIVLQSGGQVVVETQAGLGSEFTVYLPLLQPAEPAPPPEPEAEVAQPVTPSVLVVDDEPAVREVTVRALSRAGYRVIGAASGAGALDLLAREPDPSIVLLLTDIMMPDLNGHELAGIVASRWPTVRIACMSGFSPEEMRRQGLAASSRPLLHKPFTLPQLVGFVSEAFSADQAPV